MPRAKLFLLLLFFAQEPLEGFSQSTVPADIPGNVRFTLPRSSSSFQTSTITGTSSTLSPIPDQPTADVLQSTIPPAPIPTQQDIDDSDTHGGKSLGVGAIAAIVVGAIILLSGTSAAAVWYSRLKGKGNGTIKQHVFEAQSDETLPPKGAISKNNIPTQETQTVEPAPDHIRTPTDPNSESPPQGGPDRSPLPALGL
ncbi:hypothetical protein TWF481_005242 [Arthrobotrys musiformis]|uniref:Mid2 domain-containing protein n=1 Tax=Arthrobotrys musiformis TaxID=47236 RepID=A0AAV9WEU8_9PEZI